jgi:hypothetical protein
MIKVAANQLGQYILFSVVFTLPPPSHHGIVWLLPYSSLLLKVHKIEIFFGFDFEICIISLLVL